MKIKRSQPSPHNQRPRALRSDINEITTQQLEEIATALFGKPTARNGRSWRFRRRGSLVFNFDPPGFFDFESDEHGGLLGAVVHAGVATDFAGAARWLKSGGWVSEGEGVGTQVPLQHLRREDEPARIAKAQEKFARARPCDGTLVHRYLKARAICSGIPACLRILWDEYHPEHNSYFAAMVAPVTPLDNIDAITAVQLTYIGREGKKAPVTPSKRTIGAPSQNGVVLGRIEHSLIVAEGVESALSAAEHLRLPAVATLGTSGMRRLRIPERVRRAVIAFDRDADGAGERAARELAARLYAEGREVQLAGPPDNAGDWNEYAQLQAGRA